MWDADEIDWGEDKQKMVANREGEEKREREKRERNNKSQRRDDNHTALAQLHPGGDTFFFFLPLCLCCWTLNCSRSTCDCNANAASNTPWCMGAFAEEQCAIRPIKVCDAFPPLLSFSSLRLFFSSTFSSFFLIQPPLHCYSGFQHISFVMFGLKTTLKALLYSALLLAAGTFLRFFLLDTGVTWRSLISWRITFDGVKSSPQPGPQNDTYSTKYHSKGDPRRQKGSATVVFSELE